MAVATEGKKEFLGKWCGVFVFTNFRQQYVRVCVCVSELQLNKQVF